MVHNALFLPAVNFMNSRNAGSVLQMPVTMVRVEQQKRMLIISKYLHGQAYPLGPKSVALFRLTASSDACNSLISGLRQRGVTRHSTTGLSPGTQRCCSVEMDSTK
jgi:hypothetical protein